ncbi:MAG: pitrilysin family protein [Acidobacteriota bacterium]
MRQVKSIVAVLSIISFISSFSPVSAQSGRSRPRIPAREPAAPPPPPPKVPETAAVASQEQAANTSRFVLKNGMTVLVSEQHAAPISAAVACFKAGASVESDATRGFAPLLQRLIFRRSSGLKQLRALGAIADADTSFDAVSYSLIASPEKLGNALAVLSDLLRNPSLDSADINREVALLIEEEKLKPSGAPSSLGIAKIAASCLPEIQRASYESLRSVTKDQLAEFHRAHYRSENLIIAVAGDISTFNALVAVQQIFGDFATPQPPPPPAAARPAQTKPTAPAPTDAPIVKTETPAPQEPSALRYSADRVDAGETVVSLGYRAPGLKSKERAAMEMLAAIAAEGRGSRLHRVLVDEQQLATSIEANYLPFSDAGLFSVQMRPIAGLIDKAESTLFREIERLRREIPGEGEMARARAMLEKRFVDRTGNYLGRALSLARAEAAGGGYRAAVLDYRKLIRAVTAEDVQRAAAKYLILSNTSVHEMEPPAAAPRTFDAASFAATAVAWADGINQPVDPKSVRPADNAPSAIAQSPPAADAELAALESLQPLALRDFSTLNGTRSFVREDRSLPVVTVTLLFMGGRVAESDATSGLTELMLRSMLYGAARRSRAQVAQELEQLGAEVEIIDEADFFGLSLSALSRNSERALRIVRDLIEDPSFRDDDIERARRAQLEAIRSYRFSYGSRARELMFQSLYPTHPYTFPARGREEVVAKLAPDQVRDWHARTVKRQLPLAVIVGDTQGSALVSAVIAEGFRRRDVDKTIQLRVPQPATPSEKIEQRRGLLTAAAIGFAGPKRDTTDLVALELIEAMMNGPGGRLQSEMREIFSHEARMTTESLLTAGAIYFSVAVSAENEQRAREKILSQIDFSRLSEEELNAAQAMAATHNLFNLQSQRARALAYAREVFYQRDPKAVDDFSARASRVTAEEIKRVASAYFKPKMIYSGVVRGAASQ